MELRRLCAAVWLASLAILACAEGASVELDEATLGSSPPPEPGASVTLPSPSSDEDAAPRSEGGSPSASSSSGGASSGASSGASPDASSSSSSSSGASTSSSGGVGGGDCPTGDLTYYTKAVSELAGPSPKDCPCSSSECCYGGLVCVPL